MILSQLLKRELVLVKQPCQTKDEFISRLVDQIHVFDIKLPVSKEHLSQSIHTREQIGGTLLPSGLFVPHARLDDFEDFILVLGTPALPIPHEAIKIRLIALMISSQSGGDFYLPALAALTKISRDRDFFHRLCETDNAEDLIKIMCERDMELA